MPDARPPVWRGRRVRWLAGAVLLLLAGLYVGRDRLARRLIEPKIGPALRAQLGADAAWTALDVHVTPGLGEVEVRLHGLTLRGTEPGALLTEADVDDVQLTLGVGQALGGQPVPQAVSVTGARLLVDARTPPAGLGGEPLPPLDATAVQARILLPGGRALLVDDAELHARPSPAAGPGQPLEARAGGLQLIDEAGTLDLGSASAALSWRPGVLFVVGRAALMPPDGGSLALLDGARLDLQDPAGPRLRGDLQIRDVRLDRLLRGGVAARPAALTLDATLDVPLTAPDLHALLAGSHATLDARLVRVDAPDELTLRGRLADGVLVLEQAEASTRGGRVTVMPGRVQLGADWLDTQLELRGRAEVTDLEPLGALVEPLLPDLPPGSSSAAWGGGLRGWINVSGALRDPVFEVDLSGSAVRVAGWLVGDLAIRASGDRHLAHVDALEVRGPGSELRASGSVDPATLEVRDAHADLLVVADGLQDGPDARHAGASLPVRLARRLLPGVEGELQLDLHASGTLAVPVVELEACSSEVLVRGELLRVASLSAELRDGVLRVSDVVADVHGTRLHAAGQVAGLPWLPAPGGLVVRVDLLSLQRDALRLDLDEPCEIGWDGRLRISSLDLSGAAGSAHIELGEGPTAEGRTQHDLVARLVGVQTAVLPEMLRPLGLRAEVLDLDLHLAWVEDPALLVPPQAPAPWLARASDIALQVELRAEQPALDRAGLSAASAVVRGELEGDPGKPLGFLLAGVDDLRVQLPPAVADLLRVLQGAGEVETEGAPQPGQVVLVGGSGRVPAARSREPEAPRMFGPCDVGARVEIGRMLGLQSLRLDDASGLRLDIGGRVSAPLDLRAAAAGGDALVPDAALALQGSLTTGDVAALQAWLGDVRSLQGRMGIEGLLEGTVAAPRLTGMLRVSDAALSLASGLPAVESLQAVVALEQDEARVVNCTGELGSAPFELTGRVWLDESDDALDLRLTGADLLVWRGQGVKVRADVDLSLTGALARPAARGRITLRDGRLVRNLNVLQLSRLQPDAPAEPLFSFREPPLSRLQLDLALDAAEPFRIENNLVRGGLLPHLHVGGTGLAPLVEGAIEMQPTRVALPGSTVDVTRGRLTFRADQPGRPDVDLAGQTRVRGWDVTLLATGPYDEPVLQLSSTPPLASEDVLLLLLTGQPPQGARDPSLGTAAPEPVAVYLGQDLLARWISDTSGEGDGPLDKFEMNYSENVTTRGTTSIQMSYRLSGETEGEGRAIYLEAEKDPYDAVNFGLRWRFRLP